MPQVIILPFTLFFFSPSGIPRFSSQPEAGLVRHGDNHLFLCDINQDLVAFSHWELNRQPVMLDQRVFQLPSGALVVSNASDADTGLYRCVVETGGVVKSSEEAELKVIPGKAQWVFWFPKCNECNLTPATYIMTGDPAVYINKTNNGKKVLFLKPVEILNLHDLYFPALASCCE